MFWGNIWKVLFVCKLCFVVNVISKSLLFCQKHTFFDLVAYNKCTRNYDFSQYLNSDKSGHDCASISSKCHKYLSNWKFAKVQLLLKEFPVEKEVRNFVRSVKNALFSAVHPTPFQSSVTIAGYSLEAFDILDLHQSVIEDPNFKLIVSGNGILKGSTPLTHRYGGHQFGYWADQLGDGRAHLLGEYVNANMERWELQLKGSGKTPYSRRGDGRAVIRSSVREFLCSEAMFHLGIGTSRAATLVVSDDATWRDQFYDGHPVQEKLAVVLRLAKSWFRIGSYEILTISKEYQLLRKLADFVIKHYFDEINNDDPNKYLMFFSQVVESTAEMIAKWQSVGFAHGVCNTDNFSILSITIDYGPFRFLDEYDPGMVPNTSDDEERYSYEKQPDVGKFNLDKLRIALSPLLSNTQKSVMQQIISGYNDIYKEKFMDIFRKKLGIVNNESNKKDEEIVASLLKIMEDMQSDFTMTFRQLGDWEITDISKGTVPKKLWALQKLTKHSQFKTWVNMYYSRICDNDDGRRRTLMHSINPRYILRNWIAENVIKYVERGDYDLLHKVQGILSRPFEEQNEAEHLGYAEPPPSWASHIKVSCSS